MRELNEPVAVAARPGVSAPAIAQAIANGAIRHAKRAVECILFFSSRRPNGVPGARRYAKDAVRRAGYIHGGVNELLLPEQHKIMPPKQMVDYYIGTHIYIIYHRYLLSTIGVHAVGSPPPTAAASPAIRGTMEWPASRASCHAACSDAVARRSHHTRRTASALAIGVGVDGGDGGVTQLAIDLS